MKIKSTRERLLASTMIVGAMALAGAGQAAAQASAPAAPMAQPDAGAKPVAGVPGGAATIGSPASVGVPASANGQGATAAQEVVVTGSRIPQPNLRSDSPLTTVSSQEFKLEGTTDTVNLLNDLPQFTAAQNSTEVNGSNGTSQANLRNLGAVRTLVLVNGRRLQPGDPGDPVPDLNMIPSAMVDRVDVVTGGASAVYGSDAVAGVVNFIMKHDFQGVQFDVQGGFDNHQQHNGVMDQALKGGFGADGVAIPIPSDVGAQGGNLLASVILGSNTGDGKGNVTAYMQYRNNKPVLQSTRDFSYCGTIDSNFYTGANMPFTCLGSSNSAYGRFDATAAGNVANNPNGTNTFVPYSGAYAYNFNPLNFIERDDNRYSAGYFAHYQINPMVEVYSEFMFMDDDTNAQIAPSGLFRSSGPNLSLGYTINCNNPFLSAQQAADLCPAAAAAGTIVPGAAGGSYDNLQSIGYRFQSVPRNTDFTHEEFKFDLGFRGDLGDAWHYDVYGQFGETRISQLVTGYASESKVANALNVVDVNGVPTCESVVTGTDSACAPLNIFTALSSSISPAALKYVLVDALTTGEAQENVVNINLSGDLTKYGLKSPWADQGVGVNFGSEYRREQLAENFDEEQIAGDLSGSGGASPPANGSFDVYELYTEVRAPIVSNMPFAKEITLDAGYRFSDYSTAGTTNTYKIDGDWAPTRDIRFRASFNRATRAPNAVELFTPTVAGLGTYSDPCAPGQNGGAAQFTLAQCERTGVTAAQYGNGSTTDTIQQCASGQCSVLTGGNTALKPEVALTYSYGGVLTPRWVPNLNFSMDYFHIKVNHFISTGVAAPATILNECANGATSFCDLIHRDAEGTLNSASGYVNQGEANAGFLRTSGVDLSANYRLRLGDIAYVGSYVENYGSLAFNAVATYTINNDTEPFPGLGVYDCVGKFGPECGEPQPRWKTEFRTTWVTPWKATFSANWRHLGASTLDVLSSNALLYGNDGTVSAPDAKIERYNYLDLTATYKIRDQWTLRAGVTNVFDKDPPIVDSNGLPVSGPGNFGNANTFPGVYDVLGRQFFFGLTADF